MEERIFVGEAYPLTFSTKVYDIGNCTEPLLILSAADFKLILGSLNASYINTGEIQSSLL
jgi:hypothetical protein